jgi:hypothetical protein
MLMLLAVAGTMLAQTSFKGPVLGFAFDAKSGEVVRMDGVLGAARQVGLGGTFAAAAVSARTGWVLGSAGADQPLVFGGTPVPGSLNGARAVVFSELGSAAAAWYPNPGLVQVLTGFPGQPAVTREFAVEQADGLAVSDNGRLVAVRAGNEVSLLGGAPYASRSKDRVSIDDPPATNRQSAVVDGPVDVRFVEASQDLLISTPAAAWVWPSAAKQPQMLAGGFDGLRAVWLSPDGMSLYGAQGQSIFVRDLPSGNTTTYACTCQPDRWTPLATPNTFLISAQPGEPLWIFEAGSTPRILFVPARTAEAIQ